MKKIIIILLGLFLFPMTGMSQNQDKESYLKSAYELFEAGKYDNAQKALNIYVGVYHGDASVLANKIQQCKDFMDKAENAIVRQQIKDAIDYYIAVLSINPNDPIAKKKIADLEMTVKNDKPQAPKIINPIKPINRGFEMRFSSSFDSKGPFGFGLHFNRSYFKFGVDVLLSHELGSASELDLDKEYMWEDNIDILNNKFILLNQTNNYLPNESSRLWYTQSEYIYPRAQLTVSPGINLKYFSIECGLGVFICENIAATEYKIATTGKERLEGTRSIKPYFTARPTIVGYIPISEDHDCLSVSLGYNFVSGATPLNGFVVGLGFSWNMY